MSHVLRKYTFSKCKNEDADQLYGNRVLVFHLKITGPLIKTQGKERGPQGFWGSGEKTYLFSGSWGALLIILGELGSKHILLGI